MRARRRGLRALARFAAVLGLGLGALAAAGATWQSFASEADRARHPAPGQRVSIGGRQLHLRCLGEGQPTVLLEAGMPRVSGEWARVQAAVAAFTRVCAYDRAGYGWSDPGPDVRSPSQASEDLHALLQGAGVARAVVLVGHSWGGMLARYHALRFPEQVAGLVLVDPLPDHYVERMSPPEREAWDATVGMLRGLALAERLGVFRLLQGPALERSGDARRLARLPPEARESILAAMRCTGFFRTGLLEREVGPRQMEELHQRGGLGALPLSVLVAGQDKPAWQVEQTLQLAALSSQGEARLLQEAGHELPAEHPEAITEAIHRMVTRLRRDPLAAPIPP